MTRVVECDRYELPAALWSFAYFFCLLSGYYLIRPLRDALGLEGGVENLQWLFTGTLLVMLVAVPFFGFAASRLPRSRLIPAVYGFFIANILVFFFLLKAEFAGVWVARAFFIWTSVFNLFVVSVFWSFMADIFTNAQARRLFGFIAAGGSAGALTGPFFVANSVEFFGPVNLLPVSALLLGAALFCVVRLGSWARQASVRTADRVDEQALGGGVFAGIQQVMQSRYLMGICLFIWLYATLATFLYFTQAYLVEENFPTRAERTEFFAWIDFSVNVLTVSIQVFLTGRIIRWLGIPWTLALLPLFMVIGFISLGLAREVWMLGVLAGFQILRRAGNYGISRPVREILFTVVPREPRYKAKNFIDTVVYRGGDAVSGWVFAGLKGLGMSLSAIAFVAVPIALLWMAVGLRLGKKQEVLLREPKNRH